MAGAGVSMIFSFIAPPFVFEILVPDHVSALRAVVHCLTNGSFKVETDGAMRDLSYTNSRKRVLLMANFNLTEAEAATALQRGVLYTARKRPPPIRRISVLGYVSVASVLQAEAGVDDDSEDEVYEGLDAAAAAEKLRVSLDWFLSVNSNSAYADIRRRLKANHNTVLYTRKELTVVDNFGEVEVERIIAHEQSTMSDLREKIVWI